MRGVIMKVLFHVVETQKWEDTLSNAKDIIDTIPDARVAIICMSKAAEIFIKYSGIDFHGLNDSPRVKFIIGKTALRKNNISEAELPNFIEVEELVITKIAKLQNEGYAYIRL